MNRGGATTCRVVDKRDWLFRSSVFAESEMAMLQWEGRVAYEMESYECNRGSGWYPPTLSFEPNDPLGWTEQQVDDLESEWHFEHGWRQT